MATAEVVITARDRTAAALSSVQAGLNRLNRSATTVARGMNVALGVLAGTSLKRAMEGIVRATAESEAGQRGFAKALQEVKAASTDLMASRGGLPQATAAMKELGALLREPGLRAAADGFTSLMIVGFTKAAKAAGEVVAGIRQIGLAMSLATPVTQQEQIDSIGRQIEKKRQAVQLAQNQIDFSGRNSPIAVQAQANRTALLQEIAALEKRLELLQAYDPSQSKGPRGRFANTQNPAAQAANAAVARASSGSGSSLRSAAAQIEEYVVQSTKRTTSAFDELYRDWDEATRTTTERQIAEFERLQVVLDELVKAGKITQDVANKRAAEALEEVLPEVETSVRRVQTVYDGMSEYAKQAARNMQDAFANFLFNPFDGGVKGMLRGFIDAIRQMLAQAAAAKVFDALRGMTSGSTGFFGSIIGSLLGRASGGPVANGQPYIVGERGPELFVPGASGNIVPNHAMGGITVAPTYNIDARGATADLQKALPGILSENNRRIFDELDRRYGIGR